MFYITQLKLIYFTFVYLTLVVRNMCVLPQHRTSCVKQCYSMCACILYSIVCNPQKGSIVYVHNPQKGYTRIVYTCILYMYSIHVYTIHIWYTMGGEGPPPPPPPPTPLPGVGEGTPGPRRGTSGPRRSTQLKLKYIF